MPRRTDANQKELVKAIRKLGASVQDLSQVGKGCPDILVGYKGVNYLFEIKNPDMPPSKRRLTPDEMKFFEDWKGEMTIVKTIDDILGILI